MVWSGQLSRRRFLRLAGGTGALLCGGVATGLAAEVPYPSSEGADDEGVSPAEDLMREHGVLRRVLLIYDEAQRRLNTSASVDPEVLSGAAGIVRRFIEDYHEKLEEDHLFPRFERAHALTELVGTLRAQHVAGRVLTASIQSLSTAASLRAPDDRQHLGEALRLFVRMYRPHAAREDTVLLPALHRVVSRHEYSALGEDFEDLEHRLFGADGFETMVEQVAKLESALGIGDLAMFTPQG